ncbi:hypothetical protein DEU56DRAFT_919647 [Suillus clintonianus]|uniref:uncharacterized protein n=1 Tax=Suillus clintonianus TaxID=1904413 RepID=UPI001B884D84|nr:uncharacterized protein DEU56DRAFT_919647 [Suillus clintonianus]KAG2113968.1 hypothetical protein DEU56DRAFT_919647 [Suillus clintonianus]
MSNAIQKSDQLCLVVDEWVYDLRTTDSDCSRVHLHISKVVPTTPAPPQSKLQVLIAAPDLTANQVLVHLAHDSSLSRVDLPTKHILLENRLLNFTPSFPEAQVDSEVDNATLSATYKRKITLFHHISSLLRVLP